MRVRTLLHSAAIGSLFLAPTGVVEGQNLAEDPRVANAVNLVETWLGAQLDYHDIPSIAAGIVHDQELVWSKGFGYANLESQTPATPGTMYSICSISKLFTSISIMQLRDHGKLRLDDEVGAHLPWFQLEQAHDGAPPITIEGVLTHSAGLPRESDYPYWTDPFPFPTHDQIVERLSDQETLYPPWKYFQYSNLGLTLAGEIVSAESGQSFDEYVRGHILDPLGMTSTVTEVGDAWGVAKMATGYSATRRSGHRKVVNPFSGRGIAPAMGFASTVEDLGRFASWQFRLLETGEKEILPRNTLREMQRVHWVDPEWETTWGLGFSINRQDGQTFVGHGGGCPGFLTQLQIQPDDKIASIALVNSNGTNPGLFARRIHEIIGSALKSAKESPDEGKWTDRALKKYLGRYDLYPWGGEMAAIPWEGGIALVGLPTDNPMAGMTRLEHVEGDTFRRVREDKSLGEEIVFETDASGKVLRLWQHSNARERIGQE